MPLSKTLIPVLAAFVILMAPLAATHAQAVTGAGPTGNVTGSVPAGNVTGAQPAGNAGALQNPLQNINSLPALLNAILKAVVTLGSILLTIMLVYVGFLFVVAQGNPESLSKARSALVWTLIGGLILLGAESISLVVQSTVQQL